MIAPPWSGWTRSIEGEGINEQQTTGLDSVTVPLVLGGAIVGMELQLFDRVAVRITSARIRALNLR